ncbi:MAG: hypothetical protein KGM97_04175 [Alphaproteobacteria bacterium]|nr:hypothetical protein [Alphaproteobacteria bacterium]MDE2630170.1 hypothetical protein [Alphaproteobacteria bacterium]
MRSLFALTAVLALAASSPAAAQMYPGQDVTVNPGAAGTQVLLYPGGRYVRVVPVLRQPGETDAPIHLHMPARHHRLARHPQAVAAAPETAIAAPVRRAPATTDFGDFAVARPTTPQAAPPVRQRVAHTEPAPSQLTEPAPQQKKLAEPPPPRRVARVEPAPVRTPTRTATMRSNPEAESGSKRSVILFTPGATDPSVSAQQTAKSLAGDLSSALTDATSRVQLLAYGGQKGDKSSDSRRLSLKRALIIRQILIDGGVPSERIDVRAMGGVDDDGPPDRVDVFLKS